MCKVRSRNSGRQLVIGENFRDKKHLRGVVAATVLALSGPAASIEPMTIATLASTAASVVSMFDSGANPTALQTAQSHQMLKLMHERLGEFTRVFELILQRTDIAPVVRRELRYAGNAERRRELLGYIDRLRLLLGLLAKGERPGLSSPADRLAELERHANRVLTSPEDLNLPYLLLTMQMEKAIYFGFGLEATWEGVPDAPGFETLYRKRIEQMFDPDRESSLVASYGRLENDVQRLLGELEAQIEYPNIHYYSTGKGTVMSACAGPSSYDYWYVDLEEAPATVKAELHRTTAEHPVVSAIQIHDVYRVAIGEARYALAAIDGIPFEERPPRPTARTLDGAPDTIPELREILDRVSAHYQDNIVSDAESIGTDSFGSTFRYDDPDCPSNVVL